MEQIAHPPELSGDFPVRLHVVFVDPEFREGEALLLPDILDDSRIGLDGFVGMLYKAADLELALQLEKLIPETLHFGFIVLRRPHLVFRPLLQVGDRLVEGFRSNGIVRSEERLAALSRPWPSILIFAVNSSVQSLSLKSGKRDLRAPRS